MSSTQVFFNPPFEGSEKKLQINFNTETDLRSIPRSTWDSILEAARCCIISKMSSENLDAYVLSESSLFVGASSVILKTCGTTRLLQALPKILSVTKALGATPRFTQYSRFNFLFPQFQPMPYQKFDAELAFLHQFIPEGQARLLQSADDSCWHLFTEDDGKPAKDQTLEIAMFDLNESAMRLFYQHKEDDDGLPSNGAEATSLVGIDTLVPDAKIDDFLFEPCGYSCNALTDDGYFTIHVTPEKGSSYVSFETNLPFSNYTSLVRHVLNIFKPGKFCLSVFLDVNAPAKNSSSCLDWQFSGFDRLGQVSCEFENSNATFSAFAVLDKAEVKEL